MTVTELWRTRVRGTPRRRVVGESVATFAFGCILIALGLVGTSGTGHVAELPSRWIFALPLAASCLLLLAKRTHPGTAAVLGTLVLAADVAIGGSIGVIVAYFDLVYCVAVWGRRAVVRRAEVGVGTSVALSGAVCFIVTGDLRATALVLTIAFTLLATPLWWGRSVRSQTELAHMAAARAEDLHQLAQLREVEVLREERSRMAGELHDSLAGDLAAIGIHAEAVLSRPGTASDPATRTSLDVIRQASVAASDELRAMVRVLRSGDDERTAPARLAEIDGVVEQARGRGLRVDVHRPTPWPQLPATVDHAAHRIVQESLTNATKHSPGARVEIEISTTTTALELRIDSTTSPEAASKGSSGDGVGLVSMRERAEVLGGRFSAGALAGSWRVQASIPLAQDDEGRSP